MGHYQDHRRCEVCHEERLCLYYPIAPFKGQWLCSQCSGEVSNQFSDGVKTISQIECEWRKSTEGTTNA
jgi:hypothetical protein